MEDPRAFIDAVREATGIVFSSHDLRRTFTTQAESCDISHYALKALINHKIENKAKASGDTTRIYVDMTVERLREPAQRVCDKLKGLCGVVTPGGGNVATLTR